MSELASFRPFEFLWLCATLITTVVCVSSYKLSHLIQRRLCNMPFVRLSVTSDIFRLRDGMRWEYGSFQITPKTALKHWNGLFLGRSPMCHLQAYTADRPDAADISSVSRCHARLDFDTTEQKFYLENRSLRNNVYFCSVDPMQPSEPELLVDRMYLTQDTQILLGNIPLIFCILNSRNDGPEQPENTLGTGAAVLLQLLAFMFCVQRIGYITFALCVPWLLLAVTAIQTLPHDDVPFLGTLLTVLTYVGGCYITFSLQPDAAARMFSRFLFCLGAAVIALIPSLAENGSKGYNWSLWKSIFTVLLVLILLHFEIISPVDDVVLLLVLIFGVKRPQK